MLTILGIPLIGHLFVPTLVGVITVYVIWFLSTRKKVESGNIGDSLSVYEDSEKSAFTLNSIDSKPKRKVFGNKSGFADNNGEPSVDFNLKSNSVERQMNKLPQQQIVSSSYSKRKVFSNKHNEQLSSSSASENGPSKRRTRKKRCKGKAGCCSEKKKASKNIEGTVESVKVFYATISGSSEMYSSILKKNCEDKELKVEIIDLDKIDPEEKLLEETSGNSLCLFVLPTYTDGKPPESAVWFCKWLEEATNDFRIEKELLKGLKFAVFGLCNSEYKDHFNQVGKQVDEWLGDLHASRLIKLGVGDEARKVTKFGTVDADFEWWNDQLWKRVDKLNEGGKDCQCNETEQGKSSCDSDSGGTCSSDDDSLGQDSHETGVIDLEELGTYTLQKQDVKDTCSEQFSQESDQTKKDKSDYSTNVQLLKDQAEPELESQLVSCTSTHNSLQHTESTQLAADSQDTPSGPSQYSSNDIELSNDYETRSSLSTRVPSPDQSSLENTAIQESVVQCNGDITSSISSENCNKTEDIAKSSKHKKTNKQSNTKSKKNSKGKEEKQQKRPKTSAINSNTDTNQKQNNKKKENGKKDVEEENEIVVSTATQVNSSSQPESSINSIPSDISTQVEAISHQDINQDSSQKILEKHTDLTNGYDGEDTIPSCVLKGSKEVDMEGNEEKKSLPATQEPLHSEEKVQVAGSSSNHGDETSKRDLFPEFMTSSKEPPTRPVRKEKRKSSPSFAPLLTDSDETPKTHIAAKPFELPPISLRPDVPKSEPKTLHEATLSQQLKGTAEILESITAALTREPEVTPQETAHKDSSAYQKSELPTNVLNKDSAETQLSLGSPVSQEKQILSVQSLGDVSAHSAVETGVSKTQEAVPPASVSFMGDRIGDNESDKLTSSQDGNESISEFNKGTGNISEDSTQTADVLPPIPPPRGKKHNTAMKHKLTEHSPAQAWELESGNVTDESSGDSTTSSTTHESEESVIELLSSTHTSPEDKPKQSLSSDEEEDIIFRAKQIQGTDEIVDIKSIPPDKSDVCTPSISGPSLQYSSQISNTDKSSISRTPPTTAKEQMSLNLQGHSRGTKSVHLQHAEMYAEGLSKKIVLEAVSESSKKRMTLPITEAVTRWLRSQSPEVLSLPPTEDETESEISSEDQDQDEKVSDTYQNQHSTGQKNVFCNPLPVPLLEDCHHLSVNDDVNHSGHNDGTGRRVALISVFFEHEHECISEKHDNNGTSVSISKVEGDKRLKNELDDEDSIFLYKNNCISTSLKNTSNSKLDSYNDGESDINQCPKNYTSNRNYNCEHAYSSCKTSEIIPNKCSCNSEINSLKEGMQQEINMKTAKEIVNCNTSVEFYNTSSSLAGTISNTSVAGNQTNNIQERNKSEDEYSFTSDETLECEWDLWDCNPVKPPPPSNTPKNSTITPTEEMLAKSPDDYCSHMCDPAVSVAKYYSLGALQKKSVVFDEDSTDSSDEEVDALKHFQHELEDDDDGLQTSTKPLPNSRFQESDEKMAEGINENKVYGNPEIYKSVYGEAGPRMYIQEDCDRSRNIYNAALSQRAQAAHLFHRKSSVLVSRLKGDGPFPCGGICCILQ